MDTNIIEAQERRNFRTVIYYAIISICLIAVVFTVKDDKKFGQFLLDSCSSVKKGITSLSIPTGSWQCPSSETLVNFDIDSPFNNNQKGRFWYSNPSNQWLTWGSPSEPEADFYINVAWKKTPDQYNGNIRRNLRNMRLFEHGTVLVSKSYTKIDVHHGMFEALPFVFKDQTMVKKCIGFTNKQRDNSVLIRGWYCAAPQSAPKFETVDCLLSSLVIDGVLEQDYSNNWCSSSRHKRQS